MFKDIIVVGSSAGGVTALQEFCGGLPADFPGSIFIAQHVSPSSRSELGALLCRAGPLPAVTPRDGDAIERGKIYLGAPDLHILLRKNKVLMRRGPRENRFRPAVDALFRSAAVAYGPRVVGVVLTGLLDDGTEGLNTIKAAGGTSLVQDPDEAEWSSMPRSAIVGDHVDFIAPVAELARLVVRLASEKAGPRIPLPEALIREDQIAAANAFALPQPPPEIPGTASQYSCPDCGGVLNRIMSEGEYHYRCQVGHAFTKSSLAIAQAQEVERALGIAMRTHRDRVVLFKQMRRDATSAKLECAAARWTRAIEDAERLIVILENAMQTLRKEPVTEN